ncbi:MAG: WYL domain-containing protein [Thermoanaerobacterales bacterium]|nr:WYL domain-containing protein [Thermoanaerobacterales bacterium]
MRSARLLALLLRLQRVGPATARTLADELEVSERTVYRDVAMLQAAGVPLWTEAGPGGGIRLLDGWRSPVDGFTAAETVALTIGSAGAADLGLGAVLAAARSKLRSALPAAARDDLARVTERFLLDAPAWFHRDDPGEVLPTVADAVWQGRRLDIRYGRRGHGVRRRVDPLGLVLKAGTWYLVAAHRRRPRTWRVSRITSATPRPEPAWRPPGFDLARWWSASAAAFDASIRPLRARLRLSPAAARRLPRLVPGELTVRALEQGEVDAEGWVTVDLPLEPVEVAVSQLVPLPGVEVLAPDELRAALADHARDVAERNTGPPGGDRGGGRLGP